MTVLRAKKILGLENGKNQPWNLNYGNLFWRELILASSKNTLNIFNFGGNFYFGK